MEEKLTLLKEILEDLLFNPEKLINLVSDDIHYVQIKTDTRPGLLMR